MSPHTKKTLALVRARLNAGRRPRESLQYPAFGWCPKLGCLVPAEGDSLPLPEELEDLLLGLLITLERAEAVDNFNAAVREFKAQLGPGDSPLRNLWWKYDNLWGPEARHNATPSRKSAVKKTNQLIERLKKNV